MNMTTMAKLTLSDFPKFYLGYDRFNPDFFASTLDGNYPRYNVVKIGDTGYRVEVAVPGWDKGDIDISLEQNNLKITGKEKQVEDINEQFLYKGLSGKCFTKVFHVADNVQVTKAYMERGLLCVDLEDITPEEDLPRNIPIT